MEPQQANNNDELLTAIKGLQASVDDRFKQIETKYDEKFGAVDTISQTLQQAAEQAERQRQTQQQQQQQGWQPKTWDEIPQMIDTRAKQIANEVTEARQKAYDAEVRKRQEQEQQLDTEIDQQLEQLEKTGYLPKAQNPNDPNDPGVAARREVLAAASHLETPNLVKVAEQLTSMHQQGLEFDARTNSWARNERLAPLPGQFAPVGSSSGRTGNTNTGPGYDVIHKAQSMDDLIAYADRHGYGPVPTVSPNSPNF